MEGRKLKEELTSKLIELGQLAHEMSRNGNAGNDQMLGISNEIYALERSIHLEGGNYIPSREEQKCPSCLTPHESGAVFCGNCGQNIVEFYQATIESCQVCDSIVNKEANYCGICGSKTNI